MRSTSKAAGRRRGARKRIFPCEGDRLDLSFVRMSSPIVDDVALGCVYLITCLETGVRYVGQTIHPCVIDRFDEHLYAAMVRGTKTYLYNAIRKYGPDAFMIELLCAVPYDSLDRMEAYYAQELQTYIWDSPGGYNMKWCGEHGRRGLKHTEEARAKMKEAWVKNRERYLERMRSPEWRLAIGTVHRGKSISAAQRKKLSEACKAWWTPERRAEWGAIVAHRMSEEYRAHLSSVTKAWWTPDRRTEKSETMKTNTTESDRKRSSEASLAFWSVPENRERMSQLRTGVKQGPRSEQARANMSAAAKKPKTQVFKDSLKATAAQKFAALFQIRLKAWVIDPTLNAQWRYDMARKRRDGRLDDSYVAILDATPGWSWPSR